MTGKSLARYFYVFPAEAARYGVAISPEGCPIWPAGDLKFEQAIRQWKRFEFQLTRSATGEPPADFVSDNLGLEICSMRLRGIIDTMKHESDEIAWYPILIRDTRGFRHQYWVLHIPTVADVIDPEHTVFNKANDPMSGVLKACISVRAVGQRRVFRIPWGATAWVVCESIRDAVVSNHCTGLELRKVLTSP